MYDTYQISFPLETFEAFPEGGDPDRDVDVILTEDQLTRAVIELIERCPVTLSQIAEKIVAIDIRKAAEDSRLERYLCAKEEF